MSRAVFVDSSAWYALADTADIYHGDAARCLQRLLNQHRTLLTTNYVAGETYTLLRVRLGFSAAQEFLRRLHGSAFIERVHVPESWEEAAEDLLTRYDDQDFSYAHAVSFVAMRRLGLLDAFAFDRHFAVLGFTLVAEQ